MSTRKILGTAACMVIIGVSAGVSYGQFQRLTADVAPSPVAAQADASQNLASSTEASGRAEFVSASMTTWTAAENSGVVAPSLSKPVAIVQPEPPLQQFTTQSTAAATRTAPVMHNETTALADPIVNNSVPAAVAAPAVVAATVPTIQPGIVKAKPPVVQARTPQAAQATTEETVTIASRKTVTPGSLRRFRASNERGPVAPQTNTENSAADERAMSRRTATAPRAPRASVAASTRVAQRQVRLQRLWSTGVYR